MHCCEVFNSPPKRNGIFPNVVNRKEIKIHDMISEYSIRSLSNQSDRLNGFMGILGAFETSPHHLQNLWGTPIVQSLPIFLDSATRSRQTTRERHSAVGFIDGICWSIKDFQPPYLPATFLPKLVLGWLDGRCEFLESETFHTRVRQEVRGSGSC